MKIMKFFGHYQPTKIVINKKCQIFARIYGSEHLQRMYVEIIHMAYRVSYCLQTLITSIVIDLARLSVSSVMAIIFCQFVIVALDQ